MASLESPIFTIREAIVVFGAKSMNKQELIEKLNEMHSWIKDLISKIPEKEMIESIAQGDRSPKDILAHITSWNWNGIEWIKSIAEGKKPLLPMEGHKIEDRQQVFARLNEEIHTKNLSKTVKEVLNEHHESWSILMKLIETLTQEHLDRTFVFDWVPNPTPGWHIVVWRIAHADTHGKQIEEWLHIK